KEAVLDKIRAFRNGAQREIYDDARAYLETHGANIDYVDPEAGAALKRVLDDPDCYKGGAIQALKNDLYVLKDKVALAVLEERKAIIAAVDACAVKIVQTAEFVALTPDQQDQIRRDIEAHKAGLDGVTMIPILRDRAAGAQSTLMSQLLTEMARMAPPAPVAPVAPSPPGMSDGPATAPEPPKPPAFVNAVDIKPDFKAPYLAVEADVDQYVTELRKALMAEIRQGKKVIV
ncbi:MAG: hypothetical protein ACI9LT_002568, partial [Pseudoalteromonas distincta]